MDIKEAFRSAFRVIFKTDGVELDELEEYLLKFQQPAVKVKSAVSRKDILLASAKFPEGTKFISNDEIDWGKKFKPLDINEIKDIDSIVNAIQDRAFYAGNRLFGNSQFVSEADSCFDSFYVYKSHNIEGSKYVACSSYVRENSEYIFGSMYLLRSSFLVRTMWGDRLARCFETYASGFGSDLFFCYNCMDCMENMFCFNARSKRHAIGNLELPRDKYFSLKQRLLEQSAEFLKKNKTFYSMFDFAGPIQAKIVQPKRSGAARSNAEVYEVLAKVNKGYEATCRIIFGKPLGNIKESEFLFDGMESIKIGKTALGSPIHYSDSFIFKLIPRGRMLNEAEAAEAGKLSIQIDGSESLEDIVEKTERVALFRMEFYEGANGKVAESPLVYSASDVYRVMDATSAKNCAYCTMALRSEHCYGCFRILNSKFCINCRNSVGLSGCFEMDSCSKCSDSMFCHNCESLSDCMFCFNAKAERYAIGNVEVGRDDFRKIRKIVLDELAKAFESKAVRWNIYNIGARKS